MTKSGTAFMGETIDLIEELRKDKGLTRTDLANRMGVSGPQVTQTLSKKRDVRISTLCRYFDALGYELGSTVRPKRLEAGKLSNGTVLKRKR